MEKRVKSSTAGASVFALLGCNYKLIKMEWDGAGVLAKHLLWRNLSSSSSSLFLFLLED